MIGDLKTYVTHALKIKNSSTTCECSGTLNRIHLQKEVLTHNIAKEHPWLWTASQLVSTMQGTVGPPAAVPVPQNAVVAPFANAMNVETSLVYLEAALRGEYYLCFLCLADFARAWVAIEHHTHHKKSKYCPRLS